MPLGQPLILNLMVESVTDLAGHNASGPVIDKTVGNVQAGGVSFVE